MRVKSQRSEPRSTHYIGLDQGMIELYYAGQPSNEQPDRYSAEAEAIEALAQAMIRTKVGQTLTSSSVNHPGEYGRHKFNVDRFMEAVFARVEHLRVGERAAWKVVGVFEGAWQRLCLYELPDGSCRREDVLLDTGETGHSTEYKSGSDARTEFLADVAKLIRLDVEPPMFFKG